MFFVLIFLGNNKLFWCFDLSKDRIKLVYVIKSISIFCLEFSVYIVIVLFYKLF